MIGRTKDETTRLVGNAKKTGYSEIDTEVFLQGEIKPQQLSQLSRRWKTIGIAFIALCMGFFAGTSIKSSITPKWNARRNRTTCRFCDQSLPKLHHDKSYTVQSPYNNTNGELIVVTPMTVSYEYELYDGENIFTSARKELIPNLDFDYAVLGVSSARNLNRDTGEAVSLDEVYVHHFTLQPINMIGAEVLNRDENTDPYMRFPEGYALHVMADEQPYLGTNAHLLSNKNLAPINGSLELAHKECNECYYSPGKGSDCTPELSGTFRCCGDSLACTVGGEDCACATTTTMASLLGSHTTHRKRITTKYRIELDFLVSRDVHKFQRVDQWNFAAPACSININGDAVFEDYPADNFCAKRNSTIHSLSPAFVLAYGSGSLFHHVPENNEEPYLRTTVNVPAPSGGKMVWAQSHLHTGGINATLYKNGKIICATETVYGTNPDVLTNARDEQNHLVRISSCYDQIQDGISFDAGDVFTTESYYYAGTDDDRFSKSLVAGEHKNVMSMFFMGVILDGNSKFLIEDRTSVNLWNDFVHVAGLQLKKKDTTSRHDRSSNNNEGRSLRSA
jgi:hypothetical protein